MVVNAAEEGRRRILADHLDEDFRSARMLMNEAGNIVNEASNKYKRTVLRLFLI